MTDKKPNYTDAQVEQMRVAFTSATNDVERAQVVLDMASEFGKKAQSIRAKMVKEGFYVKPVKVGKTGKPSVKKEELVPVLAAAAGVSTDVIASAVNMTKQAINVLIDSFNRDLAEIAELDQTSDEETENPAS